MYLAIGEGGGWISYTLSIERIGDWAMHKMLLLKNFGPILITLWEKMPDSLYVYILMFQSWEPGNEARWRLCCSQWRVHLVQTKTPSLLQVETGRKNWPSTSFLEISFTNIYKSCNCNFYLASLVFLRSPHLLLAVAQAQEWGWERLHQNLVPPFQSPACLQQNT